MTSDAGYVVEQAPEGRTLVITGPWSAAAEALVARGEVDGLVLNYARGFREGSLGFLDRSWGIRRLNILDRNLADLEPIARLHGSLEALSVQAAPGATLDLGPLSHLRSVAGEWGLIGDTLGNVGDLASVITWRFDEMDARAFRDHVGLERLTIKDSPHLESLSGLAELPELRVLGVFAARRLRDIGDVEGLTALVELEFEDCPALDRIDEIEALINLQFLGVSDCGDLESLAPMGLLDALELFHAWGSTRVVDGDLSPLTRLPRLREIRMRDREGYRPRVADVVRNLPSGEADSR